VIAYFKKGLSFHLVPQKLDKTQLEVLGLHAYFDKKTLSATPQPLYHWKAETVSFLHVLLVWGVILLSFLNI
jgi:hypothetical protein